MISHFFWNFSDHPPPFLHFSHLLRYDIDIYKNIDIRYTAFDMATTTRYIRKVWQLTTLLVSRITRNVCVRNTRRGDRGRIVRKGNKLMLFTSVAIFSPVLPLCKVMLFSTSIYSPLLKRRLSLGKHRARRRDQLFLRVSGRYVVPDINSQESQFGRKYSQIGH